MHPGDYVLFIPPPQQGDPAAEWMPGQVAAVAGDVVTVQCLVESLTAEIGTGWARVVTAAEAQAEIDRHNNREFDRWMEREAGR